MNYRIGFVLVCCVVTLLRSVEAEDGYFESDGVKIHYTVQGEGEPVLLIHGYTANIEFQWAVPGVIKSLAQHYRVIALDNRGHGKSGKPHDPKKYGDQMAEDAVRLLDHLKIKQAHVVGYSMGAMITLKLLATHPDRLRSAVLGGSGGLREGGDLSFFDKMADSLDRGEGLKLLIEGLTPPGRPKPSEEELTAINAMLVGTNDVKALAAVARSFKGLAVADEKIKSIRVPTLAIVGSDDPLKPSIDALKELLPNLQVVVVENTDHITAFMSPKFIEAIESFLQKHSGKSR
jgi:pimeloyl-ACP methyl ester carboxylesterase